MPSYNGWYGTERKGKARRLQGLPVHNNENRIKTMETCKLAEKLLKEEIRNRKTDFLLSLQHRSAVPDL